MAEVTRAAARDMPSKEKAMPTVTSIFRRLRAGGALGSLEVVKGHAAA